MSGDHDTETLTEAERGSHACCVKRGLCKPEHYHERDVLRIVAARVAAARETMSAIIEAAPAQVDDQGVEWLNRALLLDAIGDPDSKFLRAAMAAAHADAWDEGRRTGTSRAMRHMSDEPNLPLAGPDDNPYRAAAGEGTR